MAYNNGFPIGYQQYYPQFYYQNTQYPSQIAQPQVQQPIQAQTPGMQAQSNGMTWVQGIGGAKSYLVAPNATVILWDSEAPRIYLKSADASGMPSMKTLEYTVCDSQPQNTIPAMANEEAYATKDELNAIRGELEKFRNRIDSLQNRNYRNDRKEVRSE